MGGVEGERIGLLLGAEVDWRGRSGERETDYQGAG